MKSLRWSLALSPLLLAGCLSLASQPESYTQHLETMGYQVVPNGENLELTHPRNPGIRLHPFYGGMRAIGYFAGSDYGKSHRDEWLPLINKFNQLAVAAKFYVDEDGDLAIEGYYPGDYKPQAFGLFLDAYNEDFTFLGLMIDDIGPFLD